MGETTGLKEIMEYEKDESELMVRLAVLLVKRAHWLQVLSPAGGKRK